MKGIYITESLFLLLCIQKEITSSSYVDSHYMLKSSLGLSKSDLLNFWLGKDKI